MKRIIDVLLEMGNNTMCTHAVNENILLDILDNLKPEPHTVLEIGTFNGVSAAVFTHYAKRVYTFDICVRNAEFLWNYLGIRSKISMFVGNNSQEIRDEIHGRMSSPKYLKTTQNNYNLAFIDGEHTIKAVKYDFETVKFTKRVLFHDVHTHPDIGNFVKSIGGKVIAKEFGYWERKN